MSSQEDDFLQELRATFAIEAREHLQTMTECLLELEGSLSADAGKACVERVFRAAHSLKGAARAVDFTDIETRCQTLEDTFANWKRQRGLPARGLLDSAHRTLNAITEALLPRSATPAESAPEPAPAESVDLPAAPPEPSGVPGPPRPASRPTELIPGDRLGDETVRIAVSKLDACLLEAEEMLSAKLALGQRTEDVRGLAGELESWRKEWSSVEPDLRALRRSIERSGAGAVGGELAPGVSRLVNFLEWNLDHFRLLEDHVGQLARATRQDRHAIGKLVDDLLEDSKKLLLLPFSTVTTSFAKLVRDLCHDQGKEADFLVHGEEVEIDKRTLEEMKDPLIHLLRNSVDHGIETPEQRLQVSKPARATITLAVSRVNGSKVQLLFTDDGRGIDLGKVRAAAIKRGLISTAEAGQLGVAETQALIFQSDISTSPIVTRLSGRGLGLAIVREKTEKLGGVVAVENRPEGGTAFRILLPTMRATFRGILVRAANRVFVVPTGQVERVTRVEASDVQTVEGRETISRNGSVIALVRLADVLELPHRERANEATGMVPALILGTGDQRIAFIVDAILDEHEVLAKPLRKPLSRVRNIAGAAVLGSGQLAPILNVADLLKSARKASGMARVVGDKKEETAKAKSILVAEDSITSRMLMKGILESAGYLVRTAVDGAEAFALLRTERFDIVVSDVEMPRLNGFDLTAKIRSDKEHGELPVILVTALESREDRERGIDVGASAYLVKSNFDQSNLLEAIRRLV